MRTPPAFLAPLHPGLQKIRPESTFFSRSPCWQPRRGSRGNSQRPTRLQFTPKGSSPEKDQSSASESPGNSNSPEVFRTSAHRESDEETSSKSEVSANHRKDEASHAVQSGDGGGDNKAGGSHGKFGSGNSGGGDHGGGRSDGPGGGSGGNVPPGGAHGGAVKGDESSFNLLSFLKEVPGPLLAGITAVITTVMNQFFNLYKQRIDLRTSAEGKAKEAKEKQIAEIRAEFARTSVPLIYAIAALEERLLMYTYPEKRDSLYAASGNAEEHERLCGAACCNGPETENIYTVFCFGRVLGCLEHFRKEFPVAVDCGTHAGAVMFKNLRSRISGVLAADDTILQTFAGKHFNQMVGQYDFESIPAGPLRISVASQSFCGDQMLRSRWENSLLPSGRRVLTTAAAKDNLLSFAEFSELFESSKEFRSAFSPIYSDIESLNQSETPFSWDSFHKNDRRHFWLRLPTLQSSLVDMIDFLDPAPACRFVPLHRRRRVFGLPAESKPLAVREAVHEMARIRDGRSVSTSSLHSLNLYVKGKGTGDLVGRGDCPFSQQIIFALEEMGKPYQLSFVPLDPIPNWYYDIYPTGQVPLLTDDAKIIEDSASILQHLSSLRPSTKKEKRLRICSSAVEASALAISNMQPHFLQWVLEVGSDLNNRKKSTSKARDNLLVDLNKLELMLSRFTAQKSSPFLGGTSPCLVDISIAPTLHHFDVVTEHLTSGSGVDKNSLGPATREYLSHIYEYESFQKSQPPDNAIIEGYGKLMSGEEPLEQKRVIWDTNY